MAATEAQLANTFEERLEEQAYGLGLGLGVGCWVRVKERDVLSRDVVGALALTLAPITALILA